MAALEGPRAQLLLDLFCQKEEKEEKEEEENEADALAVLVVPVSGQLLPQLFLGAGVLFLRSPRIWQSPVGVCRAPGTGILNSSWFPCSHLLVRSCLRCTFMRIFLGLTLPCSAPVGSTVDTCCVSLQRLLWYFLLCEGGLGPCLSLCNDRCPWSLLLPFMPRSSSTTFIWLVLMVPTHLAQCGLLPLCSLNWWLCRPTGLSC